MLANFLIPILADGWRFIALFAGATLLGALTGVAWLFWPLMILTLWSIYFFRDPPRVTPLREGLVVSPADGYVCSVGRFVPPPELELGDLPMQRICVFMSVFDCHVNRAPVSGRITRIAYKPGIFVNADLDKASEDNERNGFVFDTPDGRFGAVQIAGLIARRIISFSREGETVNVGDRIGLIRFGSRVDVYMPDSAVPLVGLGSKAIAGETILADTRMDASDRSYKVG